MARILHESDTPETVANLSVLLPDAVHVSMGRTHHAHAPLHPFEQQFLNERRMQPVREREFRIGRARAREALAALGVFDHPLLPAETREPVWPAGIVGSISHCEDACVVAVAESRRFSGLGIDLERIDRIDERIADTVCTADERRAVDALSASERQLRLTLLFSAKESIFKALFPLTRQFLDFQDVTLDVVDSAFRAVPTAPGILRTDALQGRFVIGRDLIATAAWLPAV